ncbi:MAG: hypothetical protein P8Z33_12310 [Gammaproteobacteria bacterium]|jgi:hypothetical protein
MWAAHTRSIPSGAKIAIYEDSAPLSFSEFFALLERNNDFAHWYSSLIADCEFEALFWELPALTTETIHKGAEFVVIESAALSRLRPDSTPFALHFAARPGFDVVEFPNLGNDALLIVPAPIDSADSFPHLAAFLRSARRSQVASLWRVAARAVFQNLGSSPRWLSTAGLGVSWLHLRLDTRPKYYNFSPYKKINQEDTSHSTAPARSLRRFATQSLINVV